MMIFLNRKQMKLSRRQTNEILGFRRAIKRGWHWCSNISWKDCISFFYYYKCYRYEYGGEGISIACYDNWKNRVSIRISDNNPYKSRYRELFG